MINREAKELIDYYEYLTKLPIYDCFGLAIHHYRLLVENLTKKGFSADFVNQQKLLCEEIQKYHDIIKELDAIRQEFLY